MVSREGTAVVVEADIQAFFDSTDRTKLLEWLQIRVADTPLLRLIGKCLHVDVLDGGEFSKPDEGTAQGSIISPMLDFLGFTMYWCRTRRGGWRLGMKTRKAKVQKFLNGLGDWCRRHRHRSLKDQHVALIRRLRGHFLYFGVNGNARSLQNVRHRAERIWFKGLQRRSQRSHRLTWKRFSAYLQAHPLPPPRISVRIWAQAP